MSAGVYDNVETVSKCYRINKKKQQNRDLKLITRCYNHQIWNLPPSFGNSAKWQTKAELKPLMLTKEESSAAPFFKPNASDLSPITISVNVDGYLVTRILSVLSTVSGDFLTRSWLRAWSLSSVPRSASPRTWWHASAGTFCCHNKLGTDGIQYNHVGVLFHLAFAKYRSRICTWWRTPQLCILPYPQSLMVDLRGINRGEITYKEPLMVDVASLLVYTKMHCTASSPFFLNLHCFVSRRNKCDAFEGKKACFISKHVAHTLELRR